MQVSFSLADILSITQPKHTRGATKDTVSGLAALDTAGPGELSFLGNPKYRAKVPLTRASVVLLPLDYLGEPQANQLFALVDNPSVALARVCARIEQLLWPRPAPGIHASASVAPGAHVASSATVGALCLVEDGAVIGERSHLQGQVYVGRGAVVGDDCWLMPGSVLAAECVLKNRVRLQPGVVVGSDGFGYEFSGGRFEKLPQVGIVLIEDDVEIGANSTVDRARFSRTVIGEGTKVDNLVQVAHNVVIGRHCVLCAQVGVSGSTTIEDYVVLAGQAGVAGHLTLGKGAKIGGGAAVTQDVAAGSYVNGSPAIPFMLERRIAVLKQRLPELFRRVGALEEQIKKSSS